MAIPPNEQYNTFEDFLMKLLSFCVGQQFFTVDLLGKCALPDEKIAEKYVSANHRISVLQYVHNLPVSGHNGLQKLLKRF